MGTTNKEYFKEQHKNFYKATFGVTFHKYMTPIQIVDTWKNKVPQQVKDCFPELDKVIEALGLAIQTAHAAYRAYEAAIVIYKATAEAIAAGVAILAGQPGYPAALATKIATDQAIRLQQQALNLLKTEAVPLILEKALQGHCNN